MEKWVSKISVQENKCSPKAPLCDLMKKHKKSPFRVMQSFFYTLTFALRRK